MARMFFYIWEDLDDPDYIKRGEHYIEQDCLDPYMETRHYIRNAQGSRRYKFDTNRIIIHGLWDVTAYATSLKRMYKHSKIDDIIAEKCLPKSVTPGSEFHNISGAEAVLKVDTLLSTFIEASQSLQKYERKVLRKLKKNIEWIIWGAGASTLDEAIAAIAADKEMSMLLYDELGFGIDFLRILYDNNKIPNSLMTLKI